LSSRAQPLLRHAVRARELDQSGHKLRMCMDVEDVARDVASRCASHERLTIAAWLPAQRAASVDPLRALRREWSSGER
jgi:hypothetical protein